MLVAVGGLSLFASLVGLLLLAEPSSPPSGQARSSDATDDADIVVTGERISRSLRDTPSSVEVFTADRRETLAGADRLDQLLEQIPNVQLGAGNSGPTIRGQDSTGVLQDLPAFLGGTRPRITLQVDGRAVGFNEFLFGVAPLWDVQQIEVFRSPQTTTQGRNSIAGAIFISTKDPTYQPQASARAIAGSRSLGQLSAAVSGPLIADQLAFRVAGDVRRSRTASKITDTMPGGNPNRDNYAMLRFKLLAEPQFLPGARLEASFTHSEAEMPMIEGVRVPFKSRRDRLAGYGIFATRVDAFTARFEAGISETLTTTTTVTHGNSHIQRFAPVGLGQTKSRVKDMSLESILNWRPDGPIGLLGGVHALKSSLDQYIDLSAVVGLGNFTDRQASLGLFGEATLRPLPDVTVTAGLRYQRDRQDRQGSLGKPGFALPIDFDQGFGAWLPKVSVAYAVTSDVTVGLLVQRAYNPGGTTLNFETGGQELFGAEFLWSSEVFARGVFADGRLRLSANLFATRFRDAQRARSRAFTVPGGRTAFWAEIRNVPKSESYGIEASAEYKASEELRLRGALGWLKTRIVDAGDADVAIDGKDFQRSPKFSGSASVDWQPIARLRLNAALRHHTGYFSDDANTPARKIDPATMIDARAAFDVGPLTIVGYGRNLLDEFAMTYLFTPTSGTAQKPRELGIGLEARF